MSGEITIAHRDAEQAEYECVYREWVDSMPDDEREEMASLGLLEPESNIQQINGKWKSVEEMTFIGEPEKPRDEDAIKTDILAHALLFISESKNIPLTLDAFISALGLYSLGGATSAELGKKHGVSKQRFSIVRTSIIDRFGLPSAPGGRTKQQRAKKRKESQ